jgi:hypothetical protein
MDRLTLVMGLTLFAVAAGCGEEKKPQATPDSSASAQPGQAELGGRIDEAVKGLASASAGGLQGDPNQPPATGIFAPGVGDRAIAAGSAPKIQLLGEGDDPKIAIGASVPKGKEHVKVLLQMALGGKPLPALLLGLDIGPASAFSPDAPGGDKPAGDKPKGDKPAATAAPAAGSAAAVPVDLGPPPTADTPMIATVTTVALPSMEGEPPKELVDALKGTVIKFTMTKTGPTGFARSFPAGVEQKLLQTIDLEVGAVEDALTAMYAPAPDKPVGVNGYWMVTDRRKSLGAEIIRYRVFTVKEIDGDSAILEIQIKQYMVDEKSELTSFVRMENPLVVEYATDAKAAVQVGPGSRFPKVGQMEAAIETTVIPAAAKGNPQAPRAELAVQVIAQMGPIELKAPDKKGGGGKGPEQPQPKKPQPPPPPAP